MDWLLVVMTATSMSLPGFQFSSTGYEPWPMHDEGSCIVARALLNRHVPTISTTCVSKVKWDANELYTRQVNTAHVPSLPPIACERVTEKP